MLWLDHALNQAQRLNKNFHVGKGPDGKPGVSEVADGFVSILYTAHPDGSHTSYGTEVKADKNGSWSKLILK